MRHRFRHATHVLRVAGLFLVGVLVFVIARQVFIPADFGVLGFYRAGAIDDARASSIAYAGSAACESCHVGKYEHELADPATPPADPVKDNRHFVLRCESCHGPLAVHAREKTEAERREAEGKESVPGTPVRVVASDTLCLGCHRQVLGRPDFQPQVLVGDHGDNDECASCHRPHRPRTDEDEE